MKILITGAAGFIGSNFVDMALAQGHHVVGLDLLTYAGHEENLFEARKNPAFEFQRGDIGDEKLVLALLREKQLDAVVNFAAESHVDKSIEGPKAFLDTNVMGTYGLLQAALKYYQSLEGDIKNKFRLLHVSTDEVFGTLGFQDPSFTENTPYAPNSPYSASKASSDHLVRAWHHTYGLPTVITNCSNNYGPRQFPEKLIPHILFCALSDRPLPVYGKGENIRDWIFVQDHCTGVMLALQHGKIGESYCFGGRSERQNLKVVETICRYLDELKPRADRKKYQEQINFVNDRPGHDLRYAIDDSKAETELGFKRTMPQFEDGLKQTIVWYLDHLDWSKAVLSKGSKLTYAWEKMSG
jgi:dTDP-glucose 4,6-dehydratase